MPQRNVATNFTFEQQRAEINLLAQDFWTQKGTVDTASTTYLKHDGSNAFTGATLAVPNAFTINSNGGAGTLTISGNLNVSGTTTTVNTTNLDVTDKNITIAKGNNADATADGAGITIDSDTDITWNFVDANDAWVSSIGVEATTHIKAARGQFTGGTSPTTGSGVEINAPDPNTGQIIAYSRDGTPAYKDLRLKGASVAMYAGSTNVLIGGFHNTGLIMESGKRLGVGVEASASEGTELAVKGTDGATNIALVPQLDIDYSQISFYNAAYDSQQGYIKYDNNDNSLQFRVNLQPRLHIKSDGKVGIGTSFVSPDTTLHINGGTDTDVLKLESTQSGANGVNLILKHTSPTPADNDVVGQIQLDGLDAGLNSTTYAKIKAIAKEINNNSEKGDITFETRNGADFTEKLRISSDGKIGINEQSPQSLLDIHDSAAANDTPEIRIESFRPTIRFADRSGSQADSEICGDNGIIFRISEESDNDTALTERVRITAAGFVQVGDGTVAAEAPLHVTEENSQGINAIFGAKDFIVDDQYNYDDANIALQGRDKDNNETGAGLQFTVRNQQNSNWLHGAFVLDRDAHYHLYRGVGNTDGTKQLTILSSGSVLVGHDADAAPDGFSSLIQVNSANHTGSIQIGRHTANSNGPILIFNKTRSGTATPSGTTALSRDDMLGGMRFFGADGTDDTCNAGGIQAYMDGDAASNSFPGRLEFLTTTGGSAAGSVKMTISENGAIVTPLGSPLSYHATNATYEIYNDDHNIEIADSTSGWHVMKQWTAAKSGQFFIKFQAMIQSGPYYYAYDVWNQTQGKRINQNGTAPSAEALNGVNACRFTNFLDVNETSAVHNMRRFKLKVGNNSGSYVGEVKPGDIIQLRMASAGNNGSLVTGSGQNLRCENFRIYSDTPGRETGGKEFNTNNAAFHAIMGGAAQSFSQNDDLTWDSTAFNRGYVTDSNNATVEYGFDVANNCFRAPHTGIYHFYCNFFMNTATDCRISIEVDGTAYTSGYIWGCNTSEGSTTANQGGSQSLYIGKGSVVKLTVQSGSIGNTYGGHTSWGGFLIG